MKKILYVIGVLVLLVAIIYLGRLLYYKKLDKTKVSYAKLELACLNDFYKSKGSFPTTQEFQSQCGQKNNIPEQFYYGYYLGNSNQTFRLFYDLTAPRNFAIGRVEKTAQTDWFMFNPTRTYAVYEYTVDDGNYKNYLNQ